MQVELATEASPVRWQGRSRSVQDIAVLAQVALQLSGGGVGALKAVGNALGAGCTGEDAASGWAFFLREIPVSTDSAAVLTFAHQAVREGSQTLDAVVSGVEEVPRQARQADSRFFAFGA